MAGLFAFVRTGLGGGARDVRLTREVRKLALPAIANSLLQTLVFVVDRVMLGAHSPDALAAMQLAGPLEWSVWSVFLAFEVGTIARVGMHVGAGDWRAARRAAWISLVLAVSIGALVALGSPLVVASLSSLGKGASAGVVTQARHYLAWTLGASPLVFASSTTFAVLQASGDTKTPLAIGVFSNVLHVGLNAMLVLGYGAPKLGALGAGISTAVTFAFEAACGLVVLWRARRIAFSPWTSPARLEMGALLGVGWPALVERLLYHLGFVAFVLFISRLGDVAMAANQALISVEAVCFLSADGFGIAAAALVAQKRGAGLSALGWRAMRVCVSDALWLLSALGLLVLAAKGPLLSAFTSDRHVLEVGIVTVPVLTVAQPFMAVSIVLAQALRGAGFTREVLAVMVTGALFVRLAATYVCTEVWHGGLVGVWVGSTADWVVRAALLQWRARVRLRA